MLKRLAVTMCVTLAMTGCSGADEVESADTGPIRIAVDSDVGSDDIMALLYLLQRPDVRVSAVTVSGTGLAHCDAGVRNVLALLDVAGAPATPVACGRATPGPVLGEPWMGAFPPEWRSGTDDMYGIELPASTRRPDQDQAVDVLRRAIEDGSTTVLALGPLTNLADAIRAEPSLVEDVERLVVMGGAVHVPGNVPDVSGAEFNLWADPAAADEVLRSGVPITLVPLDASNHVPVTTFFADALSERRGTPEADVVWRLFEAQPYLTSGMNFFWDPLAAAVAAGGIDVPIEATRLEVLIGAGPETGSLVVTDDGTVIDVVTGADAEAFSRDYLETITGEAVDAPIMPAPDISVELTMEGCAIHTPPAVAPGELVVGGTSTSGAAGDVALVAFGPGGSYERTLRWLDRVGSPTGGGIPAWIVPVSGMLLPAGADALAAWKVERGDHAIACLADGSVLALEPLTAAA